MNSISHCTCSWTTRAYSIYVYARWQRRLFSKTMSTVISHVQRIFLTPLLARCQVPRMIHQGNQILHAQDPDLQAKSSDVVQGP